MIIGSIFLRCIPFNIHLQFNYELNLGLFHLVQFLAQLMNTQDRMYAT